MVSTTAYCSPLQTLLRDFALALGVLFCKAADSCCPAVQPNNVAVSCSGYCSKDSLVVSFSLLVLQVDGEWYVGVVNQVGVREPCCPHGLV